MPGVSDIVAVNITLKAGDDNLLFILLAKDGSISRSGTGSVNNKDNALFTGITEKPLFDDLMTFIDDYTLGYFGEYKMPGQKGITCKLSIVFSFSDSSENGFIFTYGSESNGPPKDIAQFVTAAVKLTDKWFHHQKKVILKE